MKRRRGPREERESGLYFGNEELDPAPYLRILKEIDENMGRIRRME